MRTLKQRQKKPSITGWALFGLGTVFVGAFLLLSAFSAKRRKRPVCYY